MDKALPWRLIFKKFLKLGATAYGGPAIAGHMKKTIVKDYGWINEQEFLQGLALCQMIPGATFVMLSSYIGYRLRGIWGALLCPIGFVLPAFILLVILSALYFKMGDLWFIQSLFKGLGAIVVAIVLNAFVGFSQAVLKDWKVILIAALSFVGLIGRWNIVLIFLLAAVAALILRTQVSKTSPTPEGPKEIREEPGKPLFLAVLAGLICLAFAVCYVLNVRLFSLSLALSKIGVLAFGGGFTILPLFQYEVVDRFHLVSTKEFIDGIAMGQVTPGPISITATFLGYKLAGIYGALMATVAVYTPGFFIVTLLIPYFDRVKGMKFIRLMEQGILASFIGMLGLVLYNFGRMTFVDIPSVIFTAGGFIALLMKVDLSYVLSIGAILSILTFGFLF